MKYGKLKLVLYLMLAKIDVDNDTSGTMETAKTICNVQEL